MDGWKKEDKNRRVLEKKKGMKEEGKNERKNERQKESLKERKR